MFVNKNFNVVEYLDGVIAWNFQEKRVDSIVSGSGFFYFGFCS